MKIVKIGTAPIKLERKQDRPNLTYNSNFIESAHGMVSGKDSEFLGWINSLGGVKKHAILKRSWVKRHSYLKRY